MKEGDGEESLIEEKDAFWDLACGDGQDVYDSEKTRGAFSKKKRLV